MGKVHTTKGLIDRDLLKVKDVVTEGDNWRAIATVWTLNGEMVRQDSHVAILEGQTLAGTQAEMA